MSDLVLEARALVKEYPTGTGTLRALDGLDLEVPRGAFLSIMGPSGSGKSTLLHMLGGLDTPTSGEVLLDGAPLSSLSDRDLTLARRRTIGFVFQSFNLIPVLSVEENIALPAVIDGRKPAEYRARLDTVLDLVGLTEHRARIPAEVSGGQQQRAAIARALFTEPAVLLADEPTGNLDTQTGEEILALLRDAQRSLGQTICVVTHDARAAATGDDVVLLRDGRIVDRLNIAEATAPTPARGRARAKAGEDPATAVLRWLQVASA